MTPDYQRAAIKATETLIKYGIKTAPVDPLPVIKQIPGVFVMTFAEASDKAHMDRKDLLDLYGCENLDAVTNVYISEDKKHYVVTYNRLLPSRIVDMALARELGHIVLEHDGTRPEDVRDEEARCFARHLLFPRPLIKAIQETGIPITTEFLGNVTGCYERCQSCLAYTPGAHVPPELNKMVREQFADYVANLKDYHAFLSKGEQSTEVDFGTYMDNYCE